MEFCYLLYCRSAKAQTSLLRRRLDGAFADRKHKNMDIDEDTDQKYDL